MVFKGSEAVFAENTIRGEGVAGIRVAGSIKVLDNRFVGMKMRAVGPPNFAVWALPGGEVEFVRNTVTGWRHAVFGDRAKVVARHNHVSNFARTAFRLKQPLAGSVVSDTVLPADQARLSEVQID